MSKLKVRVRSLTAKGILALNQLQEEREMAQGVAILKRKDLNLNQKLRFLRATKMASPIINQCTLERINESEMDFCFNVFSGSEFITNMELKRKGAVEEMMLRVGANPEDYWVEYL